MTTCSETPNSTPGAGGRIEANAAHHGMQLPVVAMNDVPRTLAAALDARSA
jgi:hypothetical protein